MVNNGAVTKLQTNITFQICLNLVPKSQCTTFILTIFSKPRFARPSMALRKVHFVASELEKARKRDLLMAFFK